MIEQRKIGSSDGAGSRKWGSGPSPGPPLEFCSVRNKNALRNGLAGHLLLEELSSIYGWLKRCGS